MNEDMATLKVNSAWDLVPFLEAQKPIGCKWMFKKKLGPNGNAEKKKAWFIVKGYSQVEGSDHGEIFSLIVKLTSIQFILSLAIAYDLEVDKMDEKTTFLHGDLEEEIYMSQLDNFVEKGKENLICKFRKSLYGLK